MKSLRIACVGMTLLLASTARADMESGPKAGEKVPALKVFGVTGLVENKEADFAAERKDALTIYMFATAEESGIPVGGRPLARFMKTLDGEIGKIEGAAAVAVWLGDKVFDKHKDYLPKFQMSMQLAHTSLAAFDGEKSGPQGWNINSDAHLTVVIAYKGKVAKSIPYISINETDVKPIVAELKKSMDK